MQLKLYNEDFVRKTDSEQIYFYNSVQVKKLMAVKSLRTSTVSVLIYVQGF